MGLGQYDGLGEYCGPHTASSVSLILVFYTISGILPVLDLPQWSHQWSPHSPYPSHTVHHAMCINVTLVLSPAPPGVSPVQSVPDPISSYIVGPFTCTETMALNGYINICILWQEFLIGPLFIAWDSPLLVPVCAGSFIVPLS